MDVHRSIAQVWTYIDQSKVLSWIRNKGLCPTKGHYLSRPDPHRCFPDSKILYCTDRKCPSREPEVGPRGSRASASREASITGSLRPECPCAFAGGHWRWARRSRQVRVLDRKRTETRPTGWPEMRDERGARSRFISVFDDNHKDQGPREAVMNVSPHTHMRAASRMEKKSDNDNEHWAANRVKVS